MGNEFTHAVILDFEATCDAKRPPQPQEIIEFPSVLLDLATLDIVDQFEAFVRPRHHPILSPFCTELTSIQQVEVDGGDPFTVVFERHRSWLAGHGLDEQCAVAVTCGDWDLAHMLPAQCEATEPPLAEVSPFYRRWHNLKRSFCEVLDHPKQAGMAKMLRILQLPLVGRHHRGIDDCRNLAAILRALVQKGLLVEINGERP